MSIKKVIAGYFREYQEKILHDDGLFHIENKREWVPQREVDLHPLEEAEYHSGNRLCEIECQRPIKPSIEQEHDWLIENGVDYIKEKRKEWKDSHEKWNEKYQEKFQEYQKTCENYCNYFNELNKRS